MSYRIYVNDTQLFGNNESYPEWDDYVKSQGIEIGPEGGDTTAKSRTSCPCWK